VQSLFTSVGSGNNGCVHEASWATANRTCVQEGARLCTLSELQGSCAQGTGCNHDSDMLWASDGCDAICVKQHVEMHGNCTACPRGYFTNETGQTSCHECPAGQHAPNTSMTSCVVCPAGRYTGAKGTHFPHASPHALPHVIHVCVGFLSERTCEIPFTHINNTGHVAVLQLRADALHVLLDSTALSTVG